MTITSLASRCTTRFESPTRQITNTASVIAPVTRRDQLTFLGVKGLLLASFASKIDRILLLLLRSFLTPVHWQRIQFRKRLDLVHPPAKQLVLVQRELFFQLQ